MSQSVKVTAEQALNPAPAPAAPVLETDALSKAPSSVTAATSAGEDVERGADAEKPNAATRSGNEMTGKKLAFAFIGMLLSIFLIALDQTILASALPVRESLCLIIQSRSDAFPQKILTQFNALSSITWVSAGYILAQGSFMTSFGQVCYLYPPKTIFLSGIAIFEVGSVLCAAAPNINALIVGRCIAGFGASG